MEAYNLQALSTFFSITLFLLWPADSAHTLQFTTP